MNKRIHEVELGGSNIDEGYFKHPSALIFAQINSIGDQNQKLVQVSNLSDKCSTLIVSNKRENQIGFVEFLLWEMNRIKESI